MHINVHVRLQYIICPFLAKLKQVKAFFSQNVSYFSQTLKVQWLANNWVIDNVVL